VIGLLSLPLVVGSYFQAILISFFFWAFMGIAWNIVGGYAGQISLGHAAFMGTGMYTSTILFTFFGITPWASLFIGAFIALMLALLTGYMSFQFGIKGPYFILVSLAFAEIIRVIFVNIPSVGGSQGISVPLHEPTLLKFQFLTKTPFYYIFFGMLLIGLVVNWRIAATKLGYYLISIRENEDAATTLGVNPLKYKLIALSISAMLTSIGGTVWAQYLMYAEPAYAFGVHSSVEIAIRPIIGGMGTLFGPIIGSLFLTPLGEVIRFTMGGTQSGVQLLIYGGILILVVLLMPNGLIVPLRKLGQRLLGAKPQ